MAFLSKERSRESVMPGSDRKRKPSPRDRVVVQVTFTTFATGCYRSYILVRAAL